MSQPTIAAGFAASFLEYATQQGADAPTLLGRAALTEEMLSQQDARVPLAAYHALIAEAIKATGDTALLLRHTMDTRLETMSIVGQIVHSSASMKHSIRQLNRYARLLADVDIMDGAERFEVLEGNDQVWIVDHYPDPNTNFMVIEASFARFISEFRRSFPDQRFEIELSVTYPPPPHADQYPDLFRIPVRFNAERNALRIDPYWLETDFEQGKDYIFGIFTSHADSLLEELQTSATTRAMVERQILPLIHEGALSMDQVAAQMGTTRQTLYRRLKAEGVTFAQIHDDLRHRLARDYLSARKVSVNETAYLLGFSEASSFVRAFRRWTGQNPSDFRNSNG